MFGPVNPGVTYPHWSDYSNVTLANLYRYVKRMSGEKDYNILISRKKYFFIKALNAKERFHEYKTNKENLRIVAEAIDSLQHSRTFTTGENNLAGSIRDMVGNTTLQGWADIRKEACF